MEIITPPALCPGDTIALLSPSSAAACFFPHRIQRAAEFFKNQGFSVKIYPTSSLNRRGSAGSVAERVKDLHDAFGDPEVKAIVCNIGGITSNALLPHLDYAFIRSHPKIFCGYSDITLLHGALLSQAGLSTFYGPAAMTQFAEFPAPHSFTWDHFQRVLMDPSAPGALPSSAQWTDETLDWGTQADLTRPRERRPSPKRTWIRGQQKAQGRLFGGCLPSVLQLVGTPYCVDFQDRILFLENPEGESFDKGIPLSHVECQMFDLRNAGVFDKIAGLIIGRPFGYTPHEAQQFRELVAECLAPYTFPVVLDADLGHTDPMWTLPLNALTRLDGTQDGIFLEEPAVHC